MMSTRNFSLPGWFSLESAQKPQWRMAQNQKIRKKEKEGRERGREREITHSCNCKHFQTLYCKNIFRPFCSELRNGKKGNHPLLCAWWESARSILTLLSSVIYLVPLEHPWLQWISPRFAPTLAKRSRMLWICFDEWQMCSLAVAAPNFKVLDVSPRLAQHPPDYPPDHFTWWI